VTIRRVDLNSIVNSSHSSRFEKARSYRRICAGEHCAAAPAAKAGIEPIFPASASPEG
jgi:hypothetical protein